MRKPFWFFATILVLLSAACGDGGGGNPPPPPDPTMSGTYSLTLVRYDGALCEGMLSLSGPNSNLTGTYGATCSGTGQRSMWGPITLTGTGWNGTQGVMSGTLGASFVPALGGIYLVYGGTYTASGLSASVGTTPNPANYFSSLITRRPITTGGVAIANTSSVYLDSGWAAPASASTWGTCDFELKHLQLPDLHQQRVAT